MKSKITSREKNNWKTVRYKNIVVYYLLSLDGGGMDQFSQDFIPVVKKLFGHVNKICEFGSGPAFIGFSLLAHGLCDKLCLVDINPLAIEACKKTIKENHLRSKVTAYVSDALESVPLKEEWDLVVSNPPHFDGKFTNHPAESLIIDPEWIVHKKFYSKAARYLKKDGSILFVENRHGSSADTFKAMITKNGLKLIKTFQYDHPLHEVVFHNLKVLKNRINFQTIRHYIPALLKRMSIRYSKVLLVNEFPFYFIWSKKVN